jgi:hypothetical protein
VIPGDLYALLSVTLRLSTAGCLNRGLRREGRADQGHSRERSTMGRRIRKFAGLRPVARRVHISGWAHIGGPQRCSAKLKAE